MCKYLRGLFPTVLWSEDPSSRRRPPRILGGLRIPRGPLRWVLSGRSAAPPWCTVSARVRRVLTSFIVLRLRLVAAGERRTSNTCRAHFLYSRTFYMWFTQVHLNPDTSASLMLGSTHNYFCLFFNRSIIIRFGTRYITYIYIIYLFYIYWYIHFIYMSFLFIYVYCIHVYCIHIYVNFIYLYIYFFI